MHRAAVQRAELVLVAEVFYYQTSDESAATVASTFNFPIIVPQNYLFLVVSAAMTNAFIGFASPSPCKTHAR